LGKARLRSGFFFGGDMNDQAFEQADAGESLYPGIATSQLAGKGPSSVGDH
jgi:hypothetical protein